MPAENNQLYITIIAATIIILLVGGFVIAFLLLYQKRHNRHLKELVDMKTAFERTLLQTQLEIQEQTFHTISQEIHDNVGQTLSLAKVQVNIIDQSETTDKELLAEVKENIGKAMHNLRHLAKSLNSDHIQLVNLKELIAPELARMERSRIVTASIKEEGIPQPVAHQKKLILFRIVQESLQNIIKHADASSVVVHIKYDSDSLQIFVQDDGKGFNPDKMAEADGLGLHNITNRTTLIGGKAIIKSSLGEGTSITLTVPYA